MHRQGVQPDIDDPRTARKWAYAGGFSDVKPGGPSHPETGTRARRSCYFCRNMMHHLCSGRMQPDPKRGPECACSALGHPQDVTVTRALMEGR